MKRLAVLLLAACFAFPACSAKNNNNADQADPASAAVAAADVDNNLVLAQADGRVPDATPARTPSPDNEASGTMASEPPADPAIVMAQAAKPEINAPAERADIVAGTHYRLLTPAQPTSSSPDKVEVAEVFMYSCPHCFSFEPFIKSYLEDKPGYVSFVRIPASFNRIARVHTKGFYAAETLGVLDDVHLNFFRAFHNDNNRLTDDSALVSFFVANGVASEEAEKAMKSFAVDTKVRQADNLIRRYRIDSVPALVINGKYVTSGAMAGSTKKLAEVVDYLVAKEAAAM